MKSHNETILTSNDEKVAENLLNGIREIIDTTRRKAMVYVNQQVSWQYYSVGKFIVENLHADTYADYGQRIVATCRNNCKMNMEKDTHILLSLV